MKTKQIMMTLVRTIEHKIMKHQERKVLDQPNWRRVEALILLRKSVKTFEFIE